MDLSEFKRIVIKIGSSLLVDENRSLNTNWLDGLIDDLVSLKEDGHEILIVSSGAIALGGNYFGISKSEMKLEEKQAAAASGQIILAHAYQELFNKRSHKTAQILLTLDDLNNQRRYQNASNTIETLIKLDVIPIINEAIELVVGVAAGFAEQACIRLRLLNRIEVFWSEVAFIHFFSHGGPLVGQGHQQLFPQFVAERGVHRITSHTVMPPTATPLKNWAHVRA